MHAITLRKSNHLTINCAVVENIFFTVSLVPNSYHNSNKEYYHDKDDQEPTDTYSNSYANVSNG